MADFSRHGFCLQNLANLVTVGKQEIEQTRMSSLTMRSEEDFFSEFNYPDEIVTKMNAM